MSVIRTWWAPLADLVLPVRCVGCGRVEVGQLCPSCTGALSALVPVPAMPTPAPPGLPPCVALGAYDGVLRDLLLGYKERGAHRLAGPLGDALAIGVAAVAIRLGYTRGVPLVLLPVPSTAAAVRQRHGDHMARLSRRAAGCLEASGWPAAVTTAVTARPRPDSTHLDAASRAAAAAGAFRQRPNQVRRLADAQRAGALVIAVDDVITTGATLAALTGRLAESGVRVSAAATLAATIRRNPPAGSATERDTPEH